MGRSAGGGAGSGVGVGSGAGVGAGMGAGIGAGGATGGRTAQADNSNANSHGLARHNITSEDGSHQKHVTSITMDTRGLGWLLLEAGIALGLFVFIVWWTMRK